MEQYKGYHELPGRKRTARPAKKTERHSEPLDVDSLERESGEQEEEARKELRRLYMEQEIGRDANQYIVERLDNCELLTPEEEKYYTHKYARLRELAEKGDLAATEEMLRIQHHLIESNQRLVTSFAKKYYYNLSPAAKSRIDLADLHQEGSIGLQISIEKFDIKRGLRLSTYACNWIRQRMGRYIQEHQFGVGIPAHIMEERAKIFKATEGILSEGREVTLEELAQRTGFTEKFIEDRLNAVPGEDRLDHIATEEGEGTKHGSLASKEMTPLEFSQGEDKKERFHRLMEKGGLDERQKLVLSLRYGLEGEEPLTLDAIALEVARRRGEKPVSREMIRIIEKLAKKRLKNYMSRHRLKGVFLEDED